MFLLKHKKSLKIPKGLSESVYRRTDNTMDKRKSTKGQTTMYKTEERVTLSFGTRLKQLKSF